MSRAILLEPHHDDGVLFACWQILRHKAQVVTVFRGDRMAGNGYPGGPVPTIVRLTENAAALVGVLGVEWEAWDFSDVAPDLDAIADRITGLECDLLIAPAVEEGGHEDHNLVGSLAQANGAEVVQYMTYTRHGGRTETGREVPFEPSWAALKLRALACYESQIRHPATAAHFLGGLREWVA